MKLWNFDFWEFWKINFEDNVFKKTGFGSFRNGNLKNESKTL